MRLRLATHADDHQDGHFDKLDHLLGPLSLDELTTAVTRLLPQADLLERLTLGAATVFGTLRELADREALTGQQRYGTWRVLKHLSTSDRHRVLPVVEGLQQQRITTDEARNILVQLCLPTTT